MAVRKAWSSSFPPHRTIECQRRGVACHGFDIMTKLFRLVRVAAFFTAAASGLAASGFSSPASAHETKPVANVAAAASVDASLPTKLDHSGRKRVGKASFYAKQFAGRKMADGKRMSPCGNNAASRILPLGTKAKVTNLETGQSAIVRIQDRGPYAKERIVDLLAGFAAFVNGDRRATAYAAEHCRPDKAEPRSGSWRPGNGHRAGPAVVPVFRCCCCMMSSWRYLSI